MESGTSFYFQLSMTSLGELARYQGDYTRAPTLNEQAHAVATEMQNLSQIALSPNNLGLVATRQRLFDPPLQPSSRESWLVSRRRNLICPGMPGRSGSGVVRSRIGRARRQYSWERRTPSALPLTCQFRQLTAETMNEFLRGA